MKTDNRQKLLAIAAVGCLGLLAFDKVILTPHEACEPAAIELIDRLWRALGADVEHMQVEHHDEVLAATSP